jgi:hypothetical protein
MIQMINTLSKTLEDILKIYKTQDDKISDEYTRINKENHVA